MRDMAGNIIKRGSTLKIVVEFTNEEWAGLFPFDGISAVLKSGRDRHEFNIETDAASKSVLLTLDTATVKPGMAEFDIKIIRNGEPVFIPGDNSFEILISEAVS